MNKKIKEAEALQTKNSLKIKEDICRALEGKSHEFRVDFTKRVWGNVTIIAKTMEEAKKKLDEMDIEDESDNDSEYEEWGEMEDIGEIEE